jgi:hypothetical protein
MVTFQSMVTFQKETDLMSAAVAAPPTRTRTLGGILVAVGIPTFTASLDTLGRNCGRRGRRGLHLQHLRFVRVAAVVRRR